jgi:hypothetical protein
MIFNGNLYLVSLGRRRLTWQDNIKMGLQEVGAGKVVDWMLRLGIGTGGGRL